MELGELGEELVLGEIVFGFGRGSYVSGEEFGEWEDFL